VPVVLSYQSVHQQMQFMSKLSPVTSATAGGAASGVGTGTAVASGSESSLPQAAGNHHHATEQTIALKAQIARLNEEHEAFQREIVALQKRVKNDSELLISKEEAVAHQAELVRELRERDHRNQAYITSLRNHLDEALAEVKARKEAEEKVKQLAEDRLKQISDLKQTIQSQNNLIKLLGGEAPTDLDYGENAGSGSEPLFPRQDFADREQVLSNIAWGATVRAEIPAVRTRYIQAHTGPCNTCRYIGDGRVIATGGDDGKVCLWVAQTGVRTLQLSAPTQAVTSLAVAPDNSTIVATSTDHNTYVWAMRNGACTKLTGHSQSVMDVAYLNAHTLVTGSRDLTMRIYDLSGETPTQLIKCGSSLRVLATTTTGSQMIVSAHMDNTIKLWSPNTREMLGEIKSVHDTPITSLALFHDQLVLSSSVGGDLALTDIRNGKVIRRYKDSVQHKYSSRGCRAVFSPDYQYVLAGDDMGQLFVWRLNSDEPVSVVKPPVSAKGEMQCVDWARNGRQVCSVDRKGCLSIWDCSSSSDHL